MIDGHNTVSKVRSWLRKIAKGARELSVKHLDELRRMKKSGGGGWEAEVARSDESVDDQ